jgi:hypothetical protein
VLYIDLITKDSVDEHVRALLIEKKVQAKYMVMNLAEKILENVK